MLNETHGCPVCGSPVPRLERYQRQVCGDCAGKTTDGSGCKISYGTVSLRGGLLATYDDTGARYTQPECYINGIMCRAEEDRFGRGIVIQVVSDNEN